MLANGWQTLFKPHILDRGEAYWQQGHVAELHRTPDGIQAVVAGSEDYEVEIELDDGMVCDMYCSCPYAEDGSACKHMAAVLFAAEDCPGDAADTMQALGLPEADIEAFWRRNRSYSFVRDRERSRLLAEQAYDKVIPLLQEEKRLAENDLWRQRQYSAELIRLYRLTGQQEAYRRELCAQVEAYPQHDLAFIHALRGTTPDGQWPERLEQLLQLPSTNAIRLELLADSGQWPRLFAELEQRGLLHLLEAYMEPLAAWDAEKTLALFSRLIDTQMARAYDRDSYHRTIDRVRILRRYPGGDRTIARLLQGWKERYPRRTAMLDELNKAKWAGRL